MKGRHLDRVRLDAEHLRVRGLVFEGFLQFLRAGLDLLEQPRIVDGDDGLIGEGLDQLDLALGIWVDCLSCQ